MIIVCSVCGIGALNATFALGKAKMLPLRLQQVFFPKCNVYDPPVRRNYSIEYPQRTGGSYKQHSLQKSLDNCTDFKWLAFHDQTAIFVEISHT